MPVRARPVRRFGGARPQLQSVDLTDFTGGLNLRDDRFNLRQNESFDLLNVDVDGAGGFRLRKGFSVKGNTFAAVRALWTFLPSGQVVAEAGTGYAYSTDAVTWAVINAGVRVPSPDGPSRAVTFKGRLWVQRYATADAWWWTGSADNTASDPATTAWQNDYAAPSGSHMPRARCIIIRNNYCIVGNLMESGAKFGCRIRFSHPADAGSWREDDYIDINHGAEGDQITALAKWRDQLVVFKRDSMYAVYGNTADDLIATELAEDVGAVSQEAVVTTPYGIYFVSRTHGVMVLDDRGIRKVGDKIWPIFTDGTVNIAGLEAGAEAGWVNGRLWVSLPHGSATTPTHTYVYDPDVGKGGAWVLYDKGFRAYRTWYNASGRVELAGRPGVSEVYELESEIGRDMVTAASPVASHINSYYVTPFLSAGEATRKKRWKRPEFVLRGGTTEPMLVEVRKDYDPTVAARSFTVRQTEDVTGLVWDDGVAGPPEGGDWDVDNWARFGDDFDSIQRGGLLGNARAVSLKMWGPQVANEDWGVNAVTLKLIPKPVRS